MKLLTVRPAAAWSVSDVADGLCEGLRAQGVDVVELRNGGAADTRGVDAAIVITGLRTGNVIAQLQMSGVPVFVLFTESPYEQEAELALAATVDGCWTHERTSVAAFRAVCPHAWYVPHGWQARHQRPTELAGTPAHDVVFVGSGFPERISWFNAIDWTGIDLGLYGIWDGFGLKDALEPCIKSGPISNRQATALYQRAKIGLNLYRWPRGAASHGESLNPRAYELAAGGVFTISQARAELADVFGDLVPTFTTPDDAEALIRWWLEDAHGRARRAHAGRLLDCVVGDSWTHRAAHIVEHLTAALAARSTLIGATA